MKRALLKSALAAFAVIALAIPASASSYGWSTSHGGNEWMNSAMNENAGNHRVSSDRSAKGKRAARHAAAKTEGGSRAKRRTASARHESTGSWGGGQSGVASYYWQPQRLASGGWFNPNAMTAAHKTLPFGTKVRVTHQGSGRSVTVTINDRGPYVAGRIIDLSSAAAGALGIKGAGVARVSLNVMGR